MDDINEHVNVSVRFSNSPQQLDLRVPVNVSVRQLILDIQDATTDDARPTNQYEIQVITKNITLTDDQRLSDYQVTNGDILVILA